MDTNSYTIPAPIIRMDHPRRCQSVHCAWVICCFDCSREDILSEVDPTSATNRFVLSHGWAVVEGMQYVCPSCRDKRIQPRVVIGGRA